MLDLERLGVAEFDKNGNVLSIEGKSKNLKSNYAVVGLYFYLNSVVQIAKKIIPSNNGELEITSVNQSFLEKDNLKMQILSRGYTCLDTGTHEALTGDTE